MSASICQYWPQVRTGCFTHSCIILGEDSALWGKCEQLVLLMLHTTTISDSNRITPRPSRFQFSQHTGKLEAGKAWGRGQDFKHRSFLEPFLRTTHYGIFKGNNFYMQIHQTLVAVQREILGGANFCINVHKAFRKNFHISIFICACTLPCPLAWFAYWPLLTASLASFIAAGLMDVDRGPLGSGRLSDGWKYWYNAIVLSPLPRVRIAHSKFDVSKIIFHSIYFPIAKLHAKYTKKFTPFECFLLYGIAQ